MLTLLGASVLSIKKVTRGSEIHECKKAWSRGYFGVEQRTKQSLSIA